MAEQIKAGDKVRSYDFVGEDSCYREGVVVAIVNKADCYHYEIKVHKTVWEGEEVLPGLASCGYVYPPINGAQTTFGRTTNRVVKIA